MSSLKSLVYVSSATHDLSHQEVDQLLLQARRRNKQHNITGVLIYIGGNFMQYIEGDADKLALIYDIIKISPLHTGLIQLLYNSIECRDFNEWTMAYCTKNKKVQVEPYNDVAILLGKQCESSYKKTVPRQLLHDFWNINRP